MWSQVERTAVRNKKLSVRLLPPDAPTQGFAAASPRTPTQYTSYASSSSNPPTPVVGERYGGGDFGRADLGTMGAHRPGVQSSTISEDTRELVSKYDDVSGSVGVV